MGCNLLVDVARGGSDLKWAQCVWRSSHSRLESHCYPWLRQELPQPKQALVRDTSHSCLETVAPPPFEQSAEDPVVLHYSQHETYTAPGGEAPPEFAPYDASYFISGTGNVISHDHHLNEDGASQAQFPRDVLTSQKVKHSIVSYSLRQSPRLECSYIVGGRTMKPIPALSAHAMGITQTRPLSNTQKELLILISK